MGLELKKIVGKNIKKLRSNSKLSLTALSEKSGLSRQWLWRVENGKENITLDSLEKIANIYGISPISLLKVKRDEIY